MNKVLYFYIVVKYTVQQHKFLQLALYELLSYISVSFL